MMMIRAAPALRAGARTCRRPALQTAARAQYKDGVGIGSAQESAAKRPPRFYHGDKLPASKGSFVSMEGKEAVHAVKALRLKEGDLVELCDGMGSVVEGRLVAVDRSSARVEAVEGVRHVPWEGAQWEVAVACSTLKGGRADWLVEKCSELGARSLQPLLTERSPGARGARDERWHRVALAASKQSLRPYTLDLKSPCGVEELAAKVQGAPVALLAAAGAPPLREVLRRAPVPPPGGAAGGEGLLIIGPEGDFTPEEVQVLLAAGALPVGLGSLRLRAETAAVALLAAAMLMQDPAA